MLRLVQKKKHSPFYSRTQQGEQAAETLQMKTVTLLLQMPRMVSHRPELKRCQGVEKELL